MALQISYNWRSHKTQWKSGHFYTFRYNAWRNDPKPLVIVMYKIQGVHPNTGYQWNLFQTINFNYLPRSHRQLFLTQWMNYYERSGGNVKFTYQNVQRMFPFMKFAVRRYMLKPVYRIQNPIEIPPEHVEEAVVSSFDKDFSDKVKRDLVQKMQRVKGRVEQQNNKMMSGINAFRGVSGFFRGLFGRKR